MSGHISSSYLSLSWIIPKLHLDHNKTKFQEKYWKIKIKMVLTFSSNNYFSNHNTLISNHDLDKRGKNLLKEMLRHQEIIKADNILILIITER